MDSVYSCPGDPENDSQASLSPRGMILFSQTFELWKQVEESTSWWWPSSLRVSREKQHEETLLWTDKGIVPGDRTELETLTICPVRNSLDFCSSILPKRCIANVSAQGSTHKTKTKESHNTWQYSVSIVGSFPSTLSVCLSVCRVSEYRGTVVYG